MYFNIFKIAFGVFILAIVLGISSCKNDPVSKVGINQTPPATSVSQVFECPPCNSDCDSLIFKNAGTCPKCGMTLVVQSTAKKVAIFLYDGVEILDFSGPAEVFASARTADYRFEVFTVAVDKRQIISQGFLKIQPDYSLADCPQPDIIVVPGGTSHQSLDEEAVFAWLKAAAPRAEVVMSVCTGAIFLADAGLLDGKKVTTFHNAIEMLRAHAPKAEVLDSVRWVDNGHILTTAGVSAGIDGSLHLVERIMGAAEAVEVAKYMEYDTWKPNQGLVVGPVLKQ